MSSETEVEELNEWLGPKKEKRARFSAPTFRRLIGLVKPYWTRLLIASVAMVIVSLASLALPALTGILIDSVFVNKNRDGLNALALALVGVFLVQAGMVFLQNYLLSYTGERVVTDLRITLYQHLQKLSLGYFNANRTGEIMSKLTTDVTRVQNSVTADLIQLAQNSIQLIGGIAIIVVRDWRLTILILVLLGIVFVVARTFGSRLRKLSEKNLDLLAKANVVVEETVSNQKTVKAFTREDFEEKRYNSRIWEGFEVARHTIGLRSAFEAMMTFLGFSAAAAVVWYGGNEVINGNISPGELVSILIYMGIVAGPIGQLSGLYGRFQQSLGAAERIFALMDEPITVTDAPNAKPLPPVRGHLRFENVSFDYDEKTPVLHNLSFEALPGQVVALIGPSGAGKTTIANLIPRFFDLKSGRITLDGYDISTVQSRSLREQIGIVPQEPVLFGVSIRENIAYGRLEASQAEIEQAAIAANAQEFIDRLPDGYDTLVGERGVKLSGGQRQRIAIARAILRDPRILILDEATSSLDNESESLVQEALDRLMRDRTTIVIAHRLSTVERADQIVVIRSGEVVEHGTHNELIARAGLYYRLYSRNFEEEESLGLA